ncbi:Holliday junction branch migration protein RuvA [Paraferrimonas sp. SM1919]|uniref:Holliday junction branch migration protein RuvA n=1 Tax=Paraferrimonas sp. SM1919 TaxID=2662263 RepID=UPI0013D69B66|nr:Holliday junction branch migration protein RuvA [Paraferrimonas sp. SM1919]
MIGRLQGTLLEKQAPEVLIDIAGIGYEVQLPMSSFYELPEVGAIATIYTHFVVREDAQLLFGFINQGERALFRELIKVNGVGPKLGLAILSGMNSAEFVDAVATDDVARLVKLPGVGKKTAERLLIEMRDRLKNLQGSVAATAAPSLHALEASAASVQDVEGDAIAALLALGYKPAVASKAVSKIAEPGMNSEAMIKAALKAML